MSNMANSVGRPLKFKSVKEFSKQADAYFAYTPEDEWTITGLAIALGTFRKVLMEYEGRDEYSNAIKAAKQRVESAYEKSLRKNGRAGDIFGLKNFGWRDKTEIEHSGEINRNASDEELDAIIERAESRQTSKDTEA